MTSPLERVLSKGPCIRRVLLMLVLLFASAVDAFAQVPEVRPLDRLPVSFEKNVGQAAPETAFIAHGAGHAMLLTATGAVVKQPGGKDVRLQVLGARPSLPAGEAPLPGTVNYFMGADPAKWKTNVPTFARARYDDVYPGIDLVYHGQTGRLEYDFVVAPGANPDVIRMAFPGAERVILEKNGNLTLHIDRGTLVVEKPTIYQDVDGERRRISGRFRLTRTGTVRFDIARYDTRLPLVIDPVLLYSTFLGDPYLTAADIHVSPDGTMFVVGIHSALFSETQSDAFVSKISSDGSALLYTTYFGGSYSDAGLSLAVDDEGAVYVTGRTVSANFPVIAATQPGYKDLGDAFVAKLAPEGNRLVYSTYLGGQGEDEGVAIAVDAARNAYVVGSTKSLDFPVVAPQQSTRKGAEDIFIAKYDAFGNPVFATYAGGSGSDEAADAVLSGDVLFVGGRTSSFDFPSTAGSTQAGHAGSSDGVVARISTADGAVTAGTYLGGTLSEQVTSMDVDGAGAVYLTGTTSSSNFPVTSGVVQESIAGNSDSFVAKLSADFSELVYATYLGGSGSEGTGASRIAVSDDGKAVIAGFGSAGFPLVAPLFPTPSPGWVAGYIAKLNAHGTAFVYSTFWPASISAVDIGPSGDAVITGSAQTAAYPTTPDAVLVDLPGFSAMRSFVSRIGDAIVPCTVDVRPTTVVDPSLVFLASNQITVVAPSGCDWTAVANEPWLELSANGGNGIGLLDYKATSFNSGPTRSATVTIADKLVTVFQPRSGCSYELTQVPLQPSAGGSVVADLTAPADCPWVVTSLAPWVTVSPGTGAGNAQITFTLQPNNLVPERLASIAVGATYHSQAGYGITQLGQCNITLSTTLITMPRAGGTGAVSFTASPAGCTWNVLSDMGWLVPIGSGGAGGGYLPFTVPANLGDGSRLGRLLVGGKTLRVMQLGPNAVVMPSAVPPSPPAGSGVTQTFTFTFYDPNGATNLDVVNVLVNNFLDGRFGCYLAYVRSANLLYLVNDAGDALLPAAVLDGTSQSLGNGQCLVDVSASSASASGKLLTLTLRLTFEELFAGNKVIYQAARDVDGNNSGWMQQGVWNVPGSAAGIPKVVGMAPGRGGGFTYPFTFTFRDEDGFTDLVSTTVLANGFLDGGVACYFGYHVPSNSLLLLNDTGTAYLPALTLGTSETVENSQCRILAAGSEAVGNSNDLTLTLRIEFKTAFKGDRIFYVSAQDGASTSGWQAVGSWTVP